MPLPLISLLALFIAVLISCVSRLNVGLLSIAFAFIIGVLLVGAFISVVMLSLTTAADEQAAIEAMPWNTILMVSGVTVLIALMDKTGGMDLFTSILAQFSSKTAMTGVIAFISGVISVYSSSSGVVLPAFLPTIPGLINCKIEKESDRFLSFLRSCLLFSLPPWRVSLGL